MPSVTCRPLVRTRSSDDHARTARSCAYFIDADFVILALSSPSALALALLLPVIIAHRKNTPPVMDDLRARAREIALLSETRNEGGVQYLPTLPISATETRETTNAVSLDDGALERGPRNVPKLIRI
jgi:hypothetical protein